MSSKATSDAAPAAGDFKADKRGIVAWCIFDWANSAFPTVVITFVFANYYTAALASSPEQATKEWGLAISLSGIAVAILAPIFGAIADLGGRRKPWLLLFSLLCIAAGLGLWTVQPEPSFALRALILVGFANATFELGQVFYNAMLPEIAPRAMIGRISGWAWGMGYAGGLVCLTLTLVFLILPDKPLFGLEMSKGEPARASAVLVSVWYLIFAVPLFLFTPDRPVERDLRAQGGAPGSRHAGAHPGRPAPSRQHRALPDRPHDLHRRAQHAVHLRWDLCRRAL